MFRNMIIAVLAALCVAVLSTAYAGGTQADYETAYNQALAAHKEAAAVDNQWTTTDRVLESARAAAKDGDYEKATELAHQAQKLAQLSVEQAKTQSEVWQKAVVR